MKTPTMFLSPSRIAVLADKSRSTVHYWIATGALKAVRVNVSRSKPGSKSTRGTSILVRVEDWEAFIEQHTSPVEVTP